MIVTSQGLLLAARHDFGAFESCLKMCNFQQFILQANMRFKNSGKKFTIKLRIIYRLLLLSRKRFFPNCNDAAQCAQLSERSL